MTATIKRYGCRGEDGYVEAGPIAVEYEDPSGPYIKTLDLDKSALEAAIRCVERHAEDHGFDAEAKSCIAHLQQLAALAGGKA